MAALFKSKIHPYLTGGRHFFIYQYISISKRIWANLIKMSAILEIIVLFETKDGVNLRYIRGLEPAHEIGEFLNCLFWQLHYDYVLKCWQLSGCQAVNFLFHLRCFGGFVVEKRNFLWFFLLFASIFWALFVWIPYINITPKTYPFDEHYSWVSFSLNSAQKFMSCYEP